MRPPDLDGRAQAWILKSDRTDPRWQKAWDAGLAHYLVHCTWSHPFWSWYSISLVHLRPMGGVKAAHKHYPEAEYEIQIFSIDPRHPDPDPDKPLDGYCLLYPLDLVHQFHGITDSQAVQVCHHVVETIVSGRVAPDVDFHRFWIQAINETVKHYREGKHTVQ